jgi:hypothetical protein
VVNETVPASSTTYDAPAATVVVGACVVSGVGVAISRITGTPAATVVVEARRSSVAESDPIELSLDALRMPMLAAIAAVPAINTPATATAVMSVVRLVRDFMKPTVRPGVPTVGKTKANVR